MTTHEVVLFTALISFGVIVGAAWGCVTGWKAASALTAMLGALVTAVLTPLLFWFIATAIDAMVVHGYSLDRAILAGFGAVFVLSFSLPFICGGPAVVATILARRLVAKFAMPKDEAE